MESVLVDRSLNLRDRIKYPVPQNASMGLFVSHPQSYSSSSILNVQPPLLPLPPPRFISASYPNRRPRMQHNKRQQRGRPLPSATTASASAVAKAVPIIVPPRDHHRRVHAKAESKEEMNMMEFLESVSSKSPPPSSLPLPTFSLMRKPKADVLPVPCVAEDGIDAGATDDLRRLLGL